MKYAVSWEARAAASEEEQARSLNVFSRWAPQKARIVQFADEWMEGGLCRRRDRRRDVDRP
jgi:hypothetical protein